jgi:hypothetical protein
MTSMTRQYSSATSRARSAVDKTAGFWTQGTRTLTDRLPGLPQIDLIPAVERYFDFVQGTVDINRRLTIKWAGAAGTLSELVRDRAESAGKLVRDKAESAGDVVRDKAESAERTAREQAEKAEQAEKERAREARFAERQQARQAHDRARERYESLTKAELSDQLAERQLPKSGNVDELIERMVEADTTSRTLPGAVREQFESVGNVVREQAEIVREQAEQAEKERAREARKAERKQARQAHDRARERYEGLTKAELSDQLAKRQLPKSGNVDELIERLVEADSK